MTDHEGYPGRQCGEHRTVGHRAWCYDCTEWCYPDEDLTCAGCLYAATIKLKVYIDTNDWWIGYYRGPFHHYVCPLPCLVIRWGRHNLNEGQ